MSLDFDLYIEVDTGGPAPKSVHLYGGNVTHNVSCMFILAGCHDALYNSHGKKAGSIITELKKGVDHMQENPELYIPLNPSNGWGSYQYALYFLRETLVACANNPKAEIYISR